MFNRLLFWLLFPLAIPQALRLRKTAPRFAGASGEPNGVAGTGEHCTLLAIGDSLIDGVGASTFDTALVGQTAKAISTRFDVAVQWSAFGKIGADTERVRQFVLPKIPQRSFDVILISSGVNDITGLKRSSFYGNNMTALITELRRTSPNAQIVIAGLPPMNQFPLLPQPLRSLLGLRSRTFDNVAKRVATRENAIHVPIEIAPDPNMFAKDGYHPSEAGYALFAEAIAGLLMPVSTTGQISGDRNNVATSDLSPFSCT